MTATRSIGGQSAPTYALLYDRRNDDVSGGEVERIGL